MGPWGVAALLYHVASRLTYVIWVGRALRREERTAYYTRAFGEAAGFAHFQRRAAVVMNNDAVSFVILCVVTYNAMPIGVSRVVLAAVGGVLTVIGLGMKLWARAAVGADRYYWRDFFGAPPATPPAPVGGPYRWFRDPMYTIGNVHLTGLALAAASWPALGAAVFSHTAILVFNHVVERPHVRRRYGV